MHLSHLGNASTPALSISNVYQILKLAHNFLSVGQVTELGFSLTFSFTSVVVQDSQTGQTLGSPLRSEGCLSLSFFIYRPFFSLLLPS